MRFAYHFVIFAYITISTVADKCTDLCKVDSDCSGGSFTNPKGYCHKYYKVPETENEFCYDKSANRSWCLRSFAKMTPADAAVVLDNMARQESSGIAESTPTPPGPLSIPHLVPRKEFRAMSVLGKALSEPFFSLKRLRPKVQEAIAMDKALFADATDHWRHLGGPQLVCALYQFVRKPEGLVIKQGLCGRVKWGYFESDHTFESATLEVSNALNEIADHVGATWGIDTPQLRILFMPNRF